MNTFIRFFYEFISVFFDGLVKGFRGLWSGIKDMFNISKYSQVIGNYKNSFNGNEKIFVVICVIVLIIVALVIGLLLFMFIRKLIRRSTIKMSKDELLNEVANLNEQVEKLMKEKDELMAMKVSQLGLNPEDEKVTQEFFYLGNNSFYISKINNRSLSDMAAHYFWIVIAYLWLRGKKITWGEIIALFGLNALIYSATGSNTTLICFTIALLISICYKLFSLFKTELKALKRFTSHCAVLSFVVISALMLILTFSYNSQNQFLYRLNSILHERLSIGYRGIVECGISLFASDSVKPLLIK